MTIDNKLVERIAKLSRISLTETEVKNLTSELEILWIGLSNYQSLILKELIQFFFFFW